MRAAFLIFLLFLSIAVTLGQTGSARPVNASPPSAAPVIVVGFVGGFIKHDNLVHSGVLLAAHLREDYTSGVEAEVFENHRGEDAHQDILRLLDTNHDGTLSAEEKRNARIIIYGHSWGGSETVTLARKLERDSIPVLLTVQVDSVAKFHEDDSVIPTNVAQAANFYQTNGLLHGQHQIRAASPARTQILGNFRFDYDASPVRCAGYPWFARVFENPHIEIECDPTVFSRVEELIRSKLPAENPTLSAK